jgi:hypothetical protein
MKRELKLKGEYKGVKKIVKLKNPDILYTNLYFTKTPIRLEQNEITLKSDIESSMFFYHSYDSIREKFSGRYYQVDFTPEEVEFNDEKQTISYIIPEFENYDNLTKSKKNVKVEVFFTEKGYNRLVSFSGHCPEPRGKRRNAI